MTIIFLIFFLILSFIINVALVFYSRNLLKKFLWVVETGSIIFEELNSYKSHLNEIYELELFYGDRNLKGVIEHTQHLLKFLDLFKNVQNISNDEVVGLLESLSEKENNTEDVAQER